jgi:hypothetical protein
MSSAALLSCLGVRGWGPLHWWLRRDGEPEALLKRLRGAWQLAQAESEGEADPRASLLLISLLRGSTDLHPLAGAPLLPPRAGRVFRHRLVCRPGQRWLHLRSWECSSAGSPWRCCGLERCLDAALLAQGVELPAPGSSRVWLPPRRVLPRGVGRWL